MTRENDLEALSTDKPITNPKEDRLGYDSFAQYLTRIICKALPNDGLVIGIQGPWGSGKTSLLNLIVHHLKHMPEEEKPLTVQLNLWGFTTREDLTRRFLGQLEGVLSKGKGLSKKAIRLLSEFLEVVAELPLPYTSSGKTISRLLRREKVLPNLKKELVNKLKKQKKKILVVIDDVDRLTADEIRQLFGLVKAVADFPKVIYLLAYDKNVVVKALEEVQKIPGEDFLEKVVQIPINLPMPDKTSLRKIFFEQLGAILKDIPEYLFDQAYWSNVYWEGIDHFLATPRDIVRLTNALSVILPAVKDEVNPVDFVAIETLRLFCPIAYDIVRENPTVFTGYADYSKDKHLLDELKSFHDYWLKQVSPKDQLPVKRLLVRLFPKFESVWSNISYTQGWESTWRKQLQVCSPDIFPVYFQFALPEGLISNPELKAILALSKDTGAFGKKLIELANQKRPDGTTKAGALLERLEDYTQKEIPLEYIPAIVQAFFSVGDQLLRPEDESKGLLDLGNDIRIGRIIWQLLNRLPELERFEILKEAIKNGEAISIIVEEVTTIGQQHGKYGSELKPEEKRLLNVEHLEELEKLVLGKIRESANRGYLLQAPQLPHILYRWCDWEKPEGEAEEWVQKIISTDEGLLFFLEKFLQKSYVQSASDAFPRVRYRLDPKSLEPFLDPSKIVDRVQNILVNEKLTKTEKQQIALKQFLREYDLRRQGKDPLFEFEEE